MTTPLAAQSLKKGDIQLIRPNEKRSTTQNKNYDIELRISKGTELADITFTHNKRRFKYNFNPRTGQINANVQLRHGDNLFTLKVKRKTHQFLITWQPSNEHFKPAPPRPNLAQKPKPTEETKPTTIDELQPEVTRLTTSKSYFPLEGELEGITNRQQILLVNNGKKTNDYTFKNGAIKAKIPLRKGLNEIIFAIENDEGADIMRWEITYTPKRPKPDSDELEEPDESTTSGDPESVKPVNYHEYQLRKKITTYAQKFRGTRYRYGGESPGGFDCSGLVQYVMDRHDVTLPRVSRDQARKGKKVRQSKAQPGDLVFYKRGGNISHVSMVLHSSKSKLLVIHSTESGGVMVEDVMQSGYWKPKMSYIRDVISDNF